MTRRPSVVGGVDRLLTLFQRVDGAFLAGRFALFVPVLVFSQLLDAPEFGRFSTRYHAFLFAGNLALWGAHDALLVRAGATSGRVTQLILFYAVAVAATGSAGYLGDPSGLLVCLFVFLYRPLYLLLVTVYRDAPGAYRTLTVALVAAMLALVVPLPDPAWRLGGAAAVTLAFQALLVARTPGLLALRPALFLRRLGEEYGYAGNHVLSSFFIQGSLFVFSLLAREEPFAAAAQLAYLLNVVLVAQGLLYRLAVHRFARRSEGVGGRLRVFVLLSLGVAAAAVVGVALVGPRAERLLFGRAAALPALQGPLIWILLVHSLNYPLAGLLVGSGRVRSQLAVSAASAAVLVAALLLLPDRGSPWSYALALSIATSAAVVGRLVAARPLLRPPP